MDGSRVGQSLTGSAACCSDIGRASHQFSSRPDPQRPAVTFGATMARALLGRIQYVGERDGEANEGNGRDQEPGYQT